LETALHNDPSSSEDEDDEDQKEKKKMISKYIDECVEIYFNMEVESDADDYDKDDSDESDYDGDQEESTSSNKVVFLYIPIIHSFAFVIEKLYGTK